MPNITTNHAITYTNTSTVLIGLEMSSKLSVILPAVSNSIFTPHRSFYQIVFSCCWPTKKSQRINSSVTYSLLRYILHCMS